MYNGYGFMSVCFLPLKNQTRKKQIALKPMLVAVGIISRNFNTKHKKKRKNFRWGALANFNFTNN